MRGLWQLTWLETKIFLREPLGAVGTFVVPVLIFVLLGRLVGAIALAPSPLATSYIRVGIPVLASVLISMSAVLSLVTIISIYREGGILKRLRATPLRPWTILSAHVLVKLLLTLVTLILMVLAGKRYYPVVVDVPMVSFAIALVISTWSILSIGFVIASIVPTARFAQPNRGLHPVSDDRALGTVRPRDIAAARAAAGGTGAATHVYGVAARGHLEGRRMVGARRGRRGSRGRVYRVHGALGQGLSLGVMPRFNWRAPSR
jgi:ABC-2 type transporter